MKFALSILIFTISFSASAKLLRCTYADKDSDLSIEVTDKTHGSLKTGQDITCEFEVTRLFDLRESQIPKIEIEMFRPFQCSPSTKLEPEIEKTLKLELFVIKNTIKCANLVWKKYEPRVSCKIEELNFTELSKAATKTKR